MRGRPVTDQDYEDVRRLHAAGLSRNAICKETGRSGRVVSRIAAELGLSFERSEATRAATEAKKTDARTRRAALALALLDDAERLRRQLFSPMVAFNFGGKDNTYEEHQIPEPTPRDKRDLMQAIGTAIDRSVRLDEYDAGTGLPQALSLLERIATGLTGRHGTGDDEHPEPDPEQPGA